MLLGCSQASRSSHGASVVKLLLSFLLAFNSCFACGVMKSLLQQGKEFAYQQGQEAQYSSENFKIEDLYPSNQIGEVFDSDNAKKQLNQKADSPALDLIIGEATLKNCQNNYLYEDESFLKVSNDIIQSGNLETIQEFEEFKNFQCREEGDPFVFSIMRDLVIVGEIKEGECPGHQIELTYSLGIEAIKTQNEYKRKFSNDPSIQWYDVKITGGGKASQYFVTVAWKHFSNICPESGEFQIKEEYWQSDNENWEKISLGPDSTLLEQVCLDANSTKIINGIEVFRKCWKEKLSYIYQFPKTNDCLPLENNYCELVDQICLQPTPFGCALWQKNFKCLSKILKNSSSELIFEWQTNAFEISQSPNSSFAQVAARLSIFEEAEKELKESNTLDASAFAVFKGEKKQCSKNVADGLLYDCCFSYSGIAKQMGLTKCNADEISLADRREQGLCYYVGSYEEKMLDLLKTRDEHVFCCFPTKLARVVQEQGRLQLKKGWGMPKKPDCGGLTMQELASLNFSKLDLSEVFEELPRKLPENFDQKMASFQSKIQEQINQAEGQ